MHASKKFLTKYIDGKILLLLMRVWKISSNGTHPHPSYSVLIPSHVLRAHAIPGTPCSPHPPGTQSSPHPPGTQSSPHPRYLEQTEMAVSVQKTFTSYLRAAPSIINEVFKGDKAMKVFHDTSCYPFTDSVANCELHIRHCLNRSMTEFFKKMVPNSLI